MEVPKSEVILEQMPRDRTWDEVAMTPVGAEASTLLCHKAPLQSIQSRTIQMFSLFMVIKYYISPLICTHLGLLQKCGQ